MTEMLEEYALDPPLNLCKYTSAPGMKGIVEGDVIWATSAHYFNDSREIAHGLDIVSEVLSDLRRQSSSVLGTLLFERLESRLEEVTEMTVFLVSFSEAQDLLSQWRGYCPPEGGYSLGFESEGLRLQGDAQEFGLFRCEYDSEKQKELVELFINGIRSGIDESPQRDEADEAVGRMRQDAEEIVDESIVPLFVRAIAQLVSLFKDRAFAEEREWRLISKPFDAIPAQAKFRQQGAQLIPFLEFSLNANDSGSLLREVVVGPAAHPDLALRSATEFLHATGCSTCSCRPSAIPYRRL